MFCGEVQWWETGKHTEALAFRANDIENKNRIIEILLAIKFIDTKFLLYTVNSSSRYVTFVCTKDKNNRVHVTCLDPCPDPHTESKNQKSSFEPLLEELKRTKLPQTDQDKRERTDGTYIDSWSPRSERLHFGKIEKDPSGQSEQLKSINGSGVIGLALKEYLAERLERDSKDGKTDISYTSKEIADGFTEYFKALTEDENRL